MRAICRATDSQVLQASTLAIILEIVACCGVSLEEVVAETRLHTICIMLGMDSPHLAIVYRPRQNLEAQGHALFLS